MSYEAPKITYAKNLEPLDAILARVERPGDYSCGGSIVTPMPRLQVDGVGTISFPVPPEQCLRLIQSAAERAPYGRGNDTLVDESVRKVWQIQPSQIQLDDKHWNQALAAIREQVTDGLGCPTNSLDLELYKMLIYDQGGFFLSHRDTEKAPGMVGTLVVVLPSAHQGGELIIRHSGRETVLDLRNNDPAEIRFASFYADCEHEVRPISSGNRVCLIYNLILAKSKSSTPLNTPDDRPVIQAAADQLRSWGKSPKRADKAVYLLEHRYTEAALSLAVLKGRDAALARILQKAAAESDCAFHLGLVHIEESGWAEHTGSYPYSRRKGRHWDDDDDDDYDDGDFEIGEVCDWARYIDQWRDSDDQPTNYGKIPLLENEILTVGALDNEAPDETHFSEATGNEGASFERTYLRAALILWPQHAFDSICASAGIDAALSRLGQRTHEAINAQRKGLRPDILAFALDPEQKTLSFRVRKELRQDIHHIIDSRKLDMTHITQRKGSPYTLVCTKTFAHYERACQQYKKDFVDMKRLLDLPGAHTPRHRPLTQRLQTAIQLGTPWAPVPQNKWNL